jgi:hypothetical protein
MIVSPTHTFPPSAEDQAAQGKVRAPQEQTFPPSGDNPPEPARPPESASAGNADPAQDEVKLQWNSAEQIQVYQFVDQQGSLILQVPSQQLLNQAGDIAQELTHEEAPKPAAAAVEGGKDHGS